MEPSGREPPDKQRTDRSRGRKWRLLFRFTREGWFFVFATGGIGAGALNTGNNLLFLMFGFMLSVILLSGLICDVNLSRLRTKRLLPKSVYAGEPFLLELSLFNKKSWIASHSIEIEDVVFESPAEQRCFYLKVAPGSTQQARYRRTFLRRGRVTCAGFRVKTRFPFGLIERGYWIAAEDELLVYPKRIAGVTLAEQMKSQDEALRQARTFASAMSGEVTGLRPFLQGDETRRVHWRKSAARGSLVSKEFADPLTQMGEIALMLDNHPARIETDLDAFENTVAYLATFAELALRAGFAVRVFARGSTSVRVQGHASAAPVLAFLALVEASDVNGEFAQPSPRARQVWAPGESRKVLDLTRVSA